MAGAGLFARLWRAPFILLTLTILFWAGNSIIGRAVRDAIPPFTLAFLRWSGASLILLPFALSHLRRDWAAIRAGWLILLVLGLLGVAGFNTLLYLALHYTTATNSLLVQAATSPLILFFAWLLFRDRTSLPRALAMALAMTGVAVIVCQGDLELLRHFRPGFGELLTLIAAAVWALYTVLLRRKPAIDAISLLAVTFLIGIAVTAPLAGYEWMNGARIMWGADSAAAALYVATFPSLIAYLFYTRGVELVGAALAGQFINAMPLAGALLAIILLGEKLQGYHFAGMALILIGIGWFARKSRDRNA